MVTRGFPGGSAGKESSCNAGDLCSNPGLGRSPGEGQGYPLQYSGLENSTDYRPWGRKESDTTERLTQMVIKQRGGQKGRPGGDHGREGLAEA